MKTFSQFKLIFLVFMSSIALPCLLNAQTPNDTINVEYSFFGNSFFISDQEYSKSEIKTLLRNNPSTEDLMGSSSNKKTFGAIALTAGLLLTGYTLYDTWGQINNSGVTPETAILSLGIAVGLDIVGIILLSGSRYNFYKAIRKYNKDNLVSNNRLQFNVSMNRIGFTLQLK